MKDMSAKKIVLSALGVAAALLTLLAPTFILVEFRTSSYYATYNWESYTGYEWISHEYDPATLVTVFMALYGTAALVLNIVGFFVFSSSKSYAMGRMSVIGALAFSFVYMLCGFILADGSYYGTTEAYVPFFLILPAFIAFFICSGVIVEKPFNTSASAERESFTAYSAPAAKKEFFDEDKKFELLLKYKKLLDDGVITQEEFEQKKRSLLD